MSEISLQEIENRYNDVVAHPPHYTRGGIECKEAMRAMLNPAAFYVDSDGDTLTIPPIVYGWWQQAAQYLWRWYDKGGIEDLEKCIQDVKFMIEELRRWK